MFDLGKFMKMFIVVSINDILFFSLRPQDKIRCGGFGVCCGKNERPLILNTSVRKCNDVKDKNCLCGGTDKPKPCPEGYYCPTPNDKKPCEPGYYCRAGSTAPDPCPASIIFINL